ncbi:hypothetical protein R3X27_17060 [Tropicimonas sp. TH_r6]|uniref:hypothetical protein n=1 Tax=Tropicimonas sp. TH_r6 TaxID=3082085 RepID=UPI002954683F|nr:hypothetical protein [Tropicimonas sp. TH_r6]MDV7144391.1 hypothetical protein [Tropicimonas sp. TH_r6]
MRPTAIAAALMLTLLPAAALAEGCSWEHRNQSVSQCPDGHVQDATTGACVKQTTS